MAIRSAVAERQATCSTRIASTSPSRLFGRPNAWPDSAARAAATASTGSDLPFAASDLPVRSIDLDDADPGSGQMPAQPGAVGPGAFHADDVDLAVSRAAMPAAARSRPRWCRTPRRRAPHRPDRPPRPRAHPSACRRPRSPNMSSLRWSLPSLPVATGSRVGTHLPGGCRNPGPVRAARNPFPPDR